MSATTAPPSIFDGIRSIFKDKAKRRPPKDPKWREAIALAQRGTFYSVGDSLINFMLLNVGSSPNISAANTVISVFNFVASLDNLSKTKQAAERADLDELIGPTARRNNQYTLDHSLCRSNITHAVSMAVGASMVMGIANEVRRTSPVASGLLTVSSGLGLIFSASHLYKAYKHWRNTRPPSGGSGPKP